MSLLLPELFPLEVVDRRPPILDLQDPRGDVLKQVSVVRSEEDGARILLQRAFQRLAAPHVRMSVTSVEPALVDGDGDRLRELFGILLDNAARYTPEGGAVSARLQVRDRQVIVRVEDTGIGLDGQDRERVFERLYRGARARELRPSGTGLGLGIARWIVESHAGTIDLASRPEGGTIATVTLPRRSP